MSGDIAAIILAAGEAARFKDEPGDTKLVADLNGKPLIRYAAEAALEAHTDPVYVVTGHAADKVRAALAGLDVLTVHNSAFAEGLSGSLKAGIAALKPEVKAAVILLGDMPFVTCRTIDRLTDCFYAQEIEPDAVVPVRNGRRGNPVLLGRKLFTAIAQLQGDKGAAALLTQAGKLIIPCLIDDEAIETDVDTREILDGLIKRSKRVN